MDCFTVQIIKNRGMRVGREGEGGAAARGGALQTPVLPLIFKISITKNFKCRFKYSKIKLFITMIKKTVNYFIQSNFARQSSVRPGSRASVDGTYGNS